MLRSGAGTVVVRGSAHGSRRDGEQHPARCTRQGLVVDATETTDTRSPLCVGGGTPSGGLGVSPVVMTPRGPAPVSSGRKG